MLSHITFWTDLRKLDASQRAETAWWIAWYKARRGDLGGLVYENIQKDPLDGKGWAAFEPWSAGHGYLFAFRQSGGPDTQKIKLYGLTASRNYTVTNVRTGAALGTFRGAELTTNGLQVNLPNPYSASVFSVSPA
jgi:hypothetical protein